MSIHGLGKGETSNYEIVKKLGEDLSSLMKDARGGEQGWSDKVRTTIQEIAKYDDMCILSTIQSLRDKNKEK